MCVQCVCSVDVCVCSVCVCEVCVCVCVQCVCVGGDQRDTEDHIMVTCMDAASDLVPLKAVLCDRRAIVGRCVPAQGEAGFPPVGHLRGRGSGGREGRDGQRAPCGRGRVCILRSFTSDLTQYGTMCILVEGSPLASDVLAVTVKWWVWPGWSRSCDTAHVVM